MMMPVFLSRLHALMIPVGIAGARQESTSPIASLPHNLAIFLLCDIQATDPLDPFLTLTPFFFLARQQSNCPIESLPHILQPLFFFSLLLHLLLLLFSLCLGFSASCFSSFTTGAIFLQQPALL
jgi:hypothetical protein